MINQKSVTFEIIKHEYLLTVRNEKTPFHMACKEGQFDVVELHIGD